MHETSICSFHRALSFPATMATENDKWQECGNGNIVVEREQRKVLHQQISTICNLGLI